MTGLTRQDHCPDCHAGIDETHDDNCDVARCLATGEQRLQCGGRGEHPDADCGAQRWSGYWPGEQECAEFGWWPDLGRLYHGECTWDPERERWVLRSQQASGEDGL